MVKMDSGPGRLSSDASSIDFQEDMVNLGVFIILSLPNGTECQAELDHMFLTFQSCCKQSAICIVRTKIKARLHKMQHVDAVPITLDSDSSNENGHEDDGDDGSVVANVSPTTKVKLSNLDLGNVTNGFPGDPMELLLFTFVSRRKTLLRCGSR
jgi:hypothetical protein